MNINDYLTKSEIKQFTQRSDIKATWMIAINWLMIISVFVLVDMWTNPLSIALGILVLGGRQLGLGILMHEAGHRSLFKNQDLNLSVGQWLCAYPLLSDVNTYSSTHREHHQKAGSTDDPDLPNYDAYPVSKASFKRKMLRDFTGRTGLKLLAGIAKGAGDIMIRENKSNQHLPPAILLHITGFLILFAHDMAALYLMWWAAFLITYPWVARIRQIAEHGAVPDLFDPDPRLHTRTTYANWMERLIFCPNFVNYHCEHHFMASVPSYNLKALHCRLVEKGFYKDHPYAIAHGYWDVIKTAVPELNKQEANPAT